jgi:ABC-type multidrug transport system, ATPase component
MEHAITVQELTKRYEDVTAVDHVSFEVGKGEIFGFLGPNGAGKTTTIKILTGLMKPDGGKTFVAGYDVLKDPIGAKQHIGVVPEASNAYVDLTAWENLVLIGRLYGVPARKLRESCTSLLKEFGLYEVRDKLVRGFSKGMKQKLLLCMALVHDPEVLFLDEPTSGLDVESSRLLREKNNSIQRKGENGFPLHPQHGGSKPAVPPNSHNKPRSNSGHRHPGKPQSPEHGAPVPRSDLQQTPRSAGA